MNYPQIMSPVPFASKSGGPCPQLLWKRRPCCWLRYLSEVEQNAENTGTKTTKLKMNDWNLRAERTWKSKTEFANQIVS